MGKHKGMAAEAGIWWNARDAMDHYISLSGGLRLRPFAEFVGAVEDIEAKHKPPTPRRRSDCPDWRSKKTHSAKEARRILSPFYGYNRFDGLG